MSIQLTQPDFDRLVALLESLAEWRTEQARIDLMDETFAGSRRKRDVLRVQLNGTPRQAAVQVILHLARFGQDMPGRETLWVLTDRMLSYVGAGADADFLRSLPERYAPIAGTPARASAPRPLPDVQAVRDALAAHFSLKEMRDLCFKLGIDYDDISGSTKTAFARELATYMQRRKRLGELVDAIRRERKDVI